MRRLLTVLACSVLMVQVAACRTDKDADDNQSLAASAGGYPPPVADPGGEGAACGRGSPCKEGLRCDGIGANDEPGTCVADTGSESGECGRDGGLPRCGNNQVCIQARNGTKPGACYADPESAKPEGFSQLKKLQTKPINGGINPTYKGIQVSAQVMIGGNTCLAKGHSAQIQTTVVEEDGKKIHHAWPIAKRTGATNSGCPRDFAPVFKKASVNFAGLLPERDRVVVHGIMDDTSGTLAKLVFGTACALPMCAQPPPHCRMHAPQPSLLDTSGCPMLKCGTMECGESPIGGGGQMCTAVAGQLYDPATDQCKGFTNGCQRAAMLANGLVQPPENKCQ